jgi:hypothetical protein
MLCAVYSSPQETSKHSILWSDNGKTKLEKRSINAMATKKGGKKAAKKGGTKKAAKKGGAKKAAKKR